MVHTHVAHVCQCGGGCGRARLRIESFTKGKSVPANSVRSSCLIVLCCGECDGVVVGVGGHVCWCDGGDVGAQLSIGCERGVRVKFGVSVWRKASGSILRWVGS